MEQTLNYKFSYGELAIGTVIQFENLKYKTMLRVITIPWERLLFRLEIVIRQ